MFSLLSFQGWCFQNCVNKVFSFASLDVRAHPYTRGTFSGLSTYHVIRRRGREGVRKILTTADEGERGGQSKADDC